MMRVAKEQLQFTLQATPNGRFILKQNSFRDNFRRQTLNRQEAAPDG